MLGTVAAGGGIAFLALFGGDSGTGSGSVAESSSSLRFSLRRGMVGAWMVLNGQDALEDEGFGNSGVGRKGREKKNSIGLFIQQQGKS